MTNDVQLSAQESKMLAAVIAEMGDIPNTINFNNVAARVGVKYGRNARSSFKKTWDKLKSQAVPAGAVAADGEDEDDAPPKTPVKKKSPTKKVGGAKGPIKAAATKKRAKKAAKVEEDEEDDEEDQGESELTQESLDYLSGNYHEGKSTDTLSPIKSKAGSDLKITTTESVQSAPNGNDDAKMAASQQDDDRNQEYQVDEELEAGKFGMSLKAYREWKSLNSYNMETDFI